MNLLDEYTAHSHIAAVREHAEAGFHRRPRRRARRSQAESRHRSAPPSG
jgi:hypothetical protein